MASSTWTAIISLAVVPLYIKYLGIETYGLIGFFATTQALLSLLDMGLAPTINREVARCTATGDMREARNLLHNLSVIYLVTACLIAFLIILLAPYTANYWLQSQHISRDTLSRALMLMGVVVACRWPLGLYVGALMGMQRLSVSSAISIAMVTLGNVGAVAVLAFISPTIEAFFVFQACAALFHVAVLRTAAWRLLGNEGIEKFDVKRLQRIWRFSAGMSGVTLSGVLLTQLDKVILSRLLSLADFGRYTLAALVASGLYIFLTPLFNTIYPRMSALVATGQTEKLISLYRSGTYLFLSLLFPIAITAAIFSTDLLYLWTGNEQLAITSAPIVSLLLIGTALNGVMHFPYALQLAYGVTRLPLTINVILIVIMVPMTFFLAKSYGAIGGAIGWAVLNGLYLALGTWLTHRSLLKDIGRQWLFSDVTFPLGTATVIAGLGGKLIRELNYPSHTNLIIGVGLVLITFILSIFASPTLRPMAQSAIVRQFKAQSSAAK